MTADNRASRSAHAPAEALIAEVYTELRRLAAGYVRREQAQSVQATDLVHEAFLRLAKDKKARWQNRAHFVAIAAISMRRLLVEHARARGAVKRGGQQVQVTLDDRVIGADAASAPIDIVALDHALEELAALDPQQARIVELRYFAGLSVEETAEALGISAATVKRHWTIAKAFLAQALV